MDSKLLARIDATIREAHRSRHFHDVDPSVSERMWPLVRLQALADAIAEGSGAMVEVDSPEWDGERSIRVFIAEPPGPSWQQFNRLLHPDARIRMLAQRVTPLIFLLGKLSRLGPYWQENWNQYRSAAGRVVPEVIPQPRSGPWVEIHRATHAALDKLGIWPIPAGPLSSEVMSLDLPHPISRGGRLRCHPTVEEALFTDAL